MPPKDSSLKSQSRSTTGFIANKNKNSFQPGSDLARTGEILLFISAALFKPGFPIVTLLCQIYQEPRIQHRAQRNYGFGKTVEQKPDQEK